MKLRELYQVNLSWNRSDLVFIELLKGNGYLLTQSVITFEDALELHAGYEVIAFAENRVVLKDERVDNL